MLKKLPFLLLFLLTNFGFGQNRRLTENAIVSVLTCDTGAELYALFGHTAIRISDPMEGIDVVYNYGAFDFRTPNFYAKFVKGDLQYFMTTSTYDEFVADYIAEQRGVYEQKLNLTLPQKQDLFNRLAENLGSESRFYTYKFIDRNCTTKAADQVEKTIGGKLSLKVDGAGETNRAILYGYIKSHFYENLGISIMFGAKTDRDLYKVYLPMQLLQSIQNSKNPATNQPLTNSTVTVNPKVVEPESFSIFNSWYLFAIVILGLIFIKKKNFMLTWFTVNALLGIFLFGVGFYSLHEELALNYNIFLFNPLYLALVFFALKNNAKWTLNLCYACGIFLIIYLLMMLNKVHILMFLPLIVLNTAYLSRIIKHNRILLAAVK